MKIIGISGSTRKESYNTALIKEAFTFLPSDVEGELVSISEIPLYNADFEEENGIPKVVEAIKEKIASCDALIVSTPEYNNSIPGVTKNALDWLSRPADDQSRVFHNKPFALMGASTGGFGTINAQTAWLPLIRYFKFRACFENALRVSQAKTKFDANLKLVDVQTKTSLQQFIGDFVTFAKEQK